MPISIIPMHRRFFASFQIFAVQHVDVCMFSNGKFKNVVADINESYQIKPGETHRHEYSLLPVKGKQRTHSTLSFSTLLKIRLI